ncbi:MAG: hypothetical protein H0T46_09495 [Deltaproteobacteria bacterium]|nr:hypothetical protein [Deltaproteobacteria bacterium]
MAPRRFALVLCMAAACGKGSGTTTQGSGAKDDAALTIQAPKRVDLGARPLGLPDLAAYQYRTRAGHAAFKTARKAEAKGDWSAVVTACTEALAADPTHLDAAWLLAAAYGEVGRVEEVLEPLRFAVAGDFGKWGTPAIELPQLQSFLTTPTGEAWRRRIEEDRTAYLEALTRATLVEAEGELYAFDPKLNRYHRLTRTGGAVVGALASPSSREIAYVLRQGAKGKRELAVGVVDLGKGHTTKGAPAGTLGPISVVYSTKAPVGFYVGAGSPKQTWRLLSGAKLDALPTKTARPAGPRLEVKSKTARLYTLPVARVTADWDEQGLASAMRIGSSNKVVTVPNPGLIDGNSVRWSPDHSRLAFVAQLQADAVCTPGTPRAAAYSADAATGTATLLFTPSIDSAKIDRGLAVEWMTDRTLLVASGEGVSIVSLDGAAAVPLTGATDLLTPRPRPRCQVAPEDEAPDDPDATPDAAATGGGSGSTMVGPP